MPVHRRSHRMLHREEDIVIDAIKSGAFFTELAALDQGEWPGWPEGTARVGAMDPAIVDSLKPTVRR